MTQTTKTTYEHIGLSNEGIPLILGTTMKVVELVLDHKAYGWSPEELHFQHPSLSMGQIYSALAYYWDHQETLDDDIERRMQMVDELRRSTHPTALEKRLRAKGLI
ncbi:DUF433 domain-containing protein [bacterium]|nr:DUF433 domain-containing protein [bacterium]